MTTLEWKALKNHGLNMHPWKVTTVSKIMSKLRREMGEEIWIALTDILNKARLNKDMLTWHTALRPYCDQSRIEENKEENLKAKRMNEIEEQRQALIKTRSKEETVRVKPTSNTTVIRRKREINETINTERFLN